MTHDNEEPSAASAGSALPRKAPLTTVRQFGIMGGVSDFENTQREKEMSKVLSNLAKQHPDKIDSIERDDTGWIVNLTDEWVECSDPLQPSHMIFEDTVAECVAAFRGIKPVTKK